MERRASGSDARRDVKLDENVGKTSPIEDGMASPEFCEAIRRFQIGEGDLVGDA